MVSLPHTIEPGGEESAPSSPRKPRSRSSYLLGKAGQHAGHISQVDSFSLLGLRRSDNGRKEKIPHLMPWVPFVPVAVPRGGHSVGFPLEGVLKGVCIPPSRECREQTQQVHRLVF